MSDWIFECSGVCRSCQTNLWSSGILAWSPSSEKALGNRATWHEITSSHVTHCMSDSMSLNLLSTITLTWFEHVNIHSKILSHPPWPYNRDRGELVTEPKTSPDILFRNTSDFPEGLDADLGQRGSTVWSAQISFVTFPRLENKVLPAFVLRSDAACSMDVD